VGAISVNANDPPFASLFTSSIASGFESNYFLSVLASAKSELRAAICCNERVEAFHTAHNELQTAWTIHDCLELIL